MILEKRIWFYLYRITYITYFEDKQNRIMEQQKVVVSLKFIILRGSREKHLIKP